MKKVANAINEYNTEILGIQFNSGYVQPDVTRAAEGNQQEMGKTSCKKCTLCVLMIRVVVEHFASCIKLIYQSFTGRLIQLILGCAVNCDAKQQYIEAIMNMEESLQQLIMQAIQELLVHQVSV